MNRQVNPAARRCVFDGIIQQVGDHSLNQPVITENIEMSGNITH